MLLGWKSENFVSTLKKCYPCLYQVKISTAEIRCPIKALYLFFRFRLFWPNFGENLITWAKLHSNAFWTISETFLINFIKISSDLKTLFSMKNVIFNLKVWNIQIEHVKYCIFTVSTRLFRLIFVTFTNWWTFFGPKFHRIQWNLFKK